MSRLDAFDRWASETRLETRLLSKRFKTLNLKLVSKRSFQSEKPSTHHPPARALRVSTRPSAAFIHLFIHSRLFDHRVPGTQLRSDRVVFSTPKRSDRPYDTVDYNPPPGPSIYTTRIKPPEHVCFESFTTRKKHVFPSDVSLTSSESRLTFTTTRFRPA